MNNLSLFNNKLQKRKILIFACCLCLIASIWYVDYYVLKEEIIFTLIYLIPIALTTWYAGHVLGIILSIFSTFAWMSVYLAGPYVMTGSNHFFFSNFLNILLKFGVFFSFTIILSLLRASHIRLYKLSNTDYLTGAANKRSYFATLEYELNKMARYKRPLTIIFIDIDNFKYINDTKGHDAGDLLIKRAVNELKRSVRATDTVARMGGDEFSILLPETDKAGALSIVEKINNTLSGVCLEYNNQISFSIGVAVFNNIPESPDAAIAFADRLMYDVKRDAENKIKLYEYL